MHGFLFLFSLPSFLPRRLHELITCFREQKKGRKGKKTGGGSSENICMGKEGRGEGKINSLNYDRAELTDGRTVRGRRRRKGKYELFSGELKFLFRV